MLTVLDYLQIRTAHAQGESIRALAQRLGHAQKTIRKVIGSETGTPAPYRRSGPTAYPKLGPFIPFIEQVLQDDLTAPPKQRHTAMQIYRRRGWNVTLVTFTSIIPTAAGWSACWWRPGRSARRSS